jgi:hypothetical protein
MKTTGSPFPYLGPVQPVNVTALAQAAFKPPALMTLPGISTPPPPQAPGFDVKGALDALRGIMNTGQGIPNLALEYDPLTNSLRPRRGWPGSA